MITLFTNISAKKNPYNEHVEHNNDHIAIQAERISTKETCKETMGLSVV